jgi:hypothetical protein
MWLKNNPGGRMGMEKMSGGMEYQIKHDNNVSAHDWNNSTQMTRIERISTGFLIDPSK